jgi:8-oxo-dGTP pyrophosphatase MutT (NUDIX family)
MPVLSDDPALPERIRAILAARTPQPVPDDGSRPASVLVPLFFHERAWHLLFTQRTETVQAHRGQISFPGGRRDPEDVSPLATALRETEEELGLRPADVTVLGQLDEMLTIVTGYRIWPFVGTFAYPYAFAPSPFEIARILLLPLAAFFEPANFEERQRAVPDGRVLPVYYYQVQGHTVWGATARILKDFLDLLVPAGAP